MEGKQYVPEKARVEGLPCTSAPRVTTVLRQGSFLFTPFSPILLTRPDPHVHAQLQQGRSLVLTGKAPPKQSESQEKMVSYSQRCEQCSGDPTQDGERRPHGGHFPL